MDKEGHKLEPFEEALVEVPEEFVGPVVDLLGSRKGQMSDLNTADTGLTRITYVIPTRHDLDILCTLASLGVALHDPTCSCLPSLHVQKLCWEHRLLLVVILYSDGRLDKL